MNDPILQPITEAQETGLAKAQAQAHKWFRLGMAEGNLTDSYLEHHAVIDGQRGELFNVFAGRGYGGSELLVLGFRAEDTGEVWYLACAAAWRDKTLQLMPWTTQPLPRQSSVAARLYQEYAATQLFAGHLYHMAAQ